MLSISRPSVTQSGWLIALPPVQLPCGSAFAGWKQSAEERASLLGAIQRLRADCYLADGAITPSQLCEGKHVSALDLDGYHIVAQDGDGRVLGCIRLNFFPAVAYDESLESSHLWALVARMPDPIRAGHLGVMRELIGPARSQRSIVSEIGGWAVRREVRGSTIAKMLALSVYSVNQLVECDLSFFSATERNGSNLILQRFGGMPLKRDGRVLPLFFDSVYGCNMQVLWAISTPPAKYAGTVEQLRSLLCRHSRDRAPSPAGPFAPHKDQIKVSLPVKTSPCGR